LISLAIVATAFVVVFPAELPDKTALASLILGSRYHPVYVFAGVAVAFAVHVVRAVAADSLLALPPHRPLQIVVAILFAADAVLLLRGRHDKSDDEHVELRGRPPGFLRVAWTSFAVILVAALAIAGGRGLLKVLPLQGITRIAAAIMLVLADVSLAAAFSCPSCPLDPGSEPSHAPRTAGTTFSVKRARPERS
jgi:Ca2+/H+ antiporter, TMEM165/GDT1 family